MDVMLSSLLGVLVGCTIIMCIGAAAAWFITYRRHKAAHPLCTTYSRCPECRVKEEPPSHLDWLDRFR